MSEEGDGRVGETVEIPLDMANDLRQWAEALSLVEGWTLDGHGSTVLRRYKTLLTVAAFGGFVAATQQPDGSWTCECGAVYSTDLALYEHRRADHQPPDPGFEHVGQRWRYVDVLDNGERDEMPWHYDRPPEQGIDVEVEVEPLYRQCGQQPHSGRQP